MSAMRRAASQRRARIAAARQGTRAGRCRLPAARNRPGRAVRWQARVRPHPATPWTWWRLCCCMWPGTTAGGPDRPSWRVQVGMVQREGLERQPAQPAHVLLAAHTESQSRPLHSASVRKVSTMKAVLCLALAHTPCSMQEEKSRDRSAAHPRRPSGGPSDPDCLRPSPSGRHTF